MGFFFSQMKGRKMKSLNAVASSIVLVLVTFAAPARGDDTVVELRFENRRFIPQTITVPANQPLTLRITNTSKEAIEFESFKLNREKVVGPGETITVRLPALRPGNYDFYDDFHQDVPAGSIVAK
jgi:Cupredoxin-like domain